MNESGMLLKKMEIHIKRRCGFYGLVIFAVIFQEIGKSYYNAQQSALYPRIRLTLLFSERQMQQHCKIFKAVKLSFEQRRLFHPAVGLGK